MNRTEKLAHEAKRWIDTLTSMLAMEWFPGRTRFAKDKDSAHKSRRDLISMCERIRILRVALLALRPYVVVPIGTEIDLDALKNGFIVHTPG